MNEFHGIIFAYSASPDLRELVKNRTAASLPFCGNYRLIDFSLSSLRNAGIIDAGIIMQRDYQSLLDHIGSGKPWDMSRRSGGIRMLPPFGLPEYHKGDYAGTMEALIAVSSYIKSIPQKYIVLLLGNCCANLDLSTICYQHTHTDCEITAICANYQPDIPHHRFVVGADGYINQVLFDRMGYSDGIPSLEGYIINKDTLLRLMDRCRSQDLYRFHRDAISIFLREGGKMIPYVHKTYARVIRTVDGYYAANMDMLVPSNRATLFPVGRPVRTRYPDGVSTYYGPESETRKALIADNCKIEGTVENSIIFSNVTVKKGAHIKNSIIMSGCEIEEGCDFNYVIADKDCSFSCDSTLTGSSKLPLVVPKATIL